MSKEMTREEFLKFWKNEIKEEDIEHIPEEATFYTYNHYDDMQYAIEADTKRAIDNIKKDNDIGGIPFTRLEVDERAINDYIREVFTSEYQEEGINGLWFWWQA